MSGKQRSWAKNITTVKDTASSRYKIGKLDIPCIGTYCYIYIRPSVEEAGRENPLDATARIHVVSWISVSKENHSALSFVIMARFLLILFSGSHLFSIYLDVTLSKSTVPGSHWFAYA